MNRNIFFAVLLTSLALAHHGYAGKTRVAPNTVNLLGDQVGSLSLVGVQSDGQFIVSGDFDIIDGRAHRNFARITADGRLDSSWGNIVTYTSLVMDGDDIYAEWVNSSGNRVVTQLNEHGSMGTNWVYTTTNDYEVVAVNSTGIFVWHNEFYGPSYLTKVNKRTGVADWSYTFTNGIYTDILRCDDTGIYYIPVDDDYSRHEIYKLDNATGALDWVAYIYNIIYLASDGVSLYYVAHPLESSYYISRIGIESGVIDSNWVCMADASINSLEFDDMGVYAGGDFTTIGGVVLNGLAKIDKTTGLPVSSWNLVVPGVRVRVFQTDDTSIYAIELGLTGTNYLAKIDKMTAAIDWVLPVIGYDPVNVAITRTSVFLSALDSDDRNMTYFAKFDKTTGAMEKFFGKLNYYHSGTASCLARQSDGKMYVKGDFVTANGKPHAGFVRLNADGGVDDGWRCDDQRATAIAVDDTGLYIVADYPHNGTLLPGSTIVTKVTKSPGMAVTNWQCWIAGYWFNYARTHLVVDADSVYVGGQFYSTHSTARSDYIVKLDKMTGEVDFRWNSGKSGEDEDQSGVDALAVDGASVYAGGSFFGIGGRRRNHVAKLNKISGKAEALWNAHWPYNSYSSIGAIAVDEASVYIGGRIYDANGRQYVGIAKLDKTTGRADPAWSCIADGIVNSIVIDGNWLYVGGGFLTINGTARSHIARLNKLTGAVDPNWIHNTDGDVASLLVANGICYLAGSFTKIGLQDHFGFGAILPGLDSTPGDYDGDHIADLALYKPSTGQWTIKLSSVKNTPSNFSMTSGASWIPVRGDFDGDGRTDPALYSPDMGQFVVKASAHGYREYYVALGGPGCIPMPGDYDNDGVTDFMVYLPSAGLWTGLLSSSGFMPATLPSLGGPDWLPVDGDFNGDGSCDPAVYNEATGQWRILDSSRDYRELDLAITLGGPGFQAMSGDFDGDGFDDFAVYSSAIGEWEIALSAMGYAKINVTCGGAGYMPIPGDYDGDGITDIGVYSATQGQGIALMSSSWTFVQTALGGPGYRPCNP